MTAFSGEAERKGKKQRKKEKKLHSLPKLMILRLENTTGMVQRPKMRYTEKQSYYNATPNTSGTRQAQKEHHTPRLIQAESKR